MTRRFCHAVWAALVFASCGGESVEHGDEDGPSDAGMGGDVSSGGTTSSGGSRSGGDSGDGGTPSTGGSSAGDDDDDSGGATGGTAARGGVAGSVAGASRGGTGGTIGISGAGGTAGGCGSVTCTPMGATYCGQIGDDCGGSIDCGTCFGDWTCEMGICVGGPSCIPNAECNVGGAELCGSVGDGCGRSLECPACPSDQECRNRVCVSPGCVPIACATAALTFCGLIGDGCGGSLDCTFCPVGMPCGGGGIEGVCGAMDCPTRVSCDGEAGEQLYCGRIGNGCGGVLDCPATCSNGMACGAEAPNVCPGSVAVPPEVPQSPPPAPPPPPPSPPPPVRR